MFEQDDNARLSAKVTVDFTNKFAASVLFNHRSADSYAKLCFQRLHSGGLLKALRLPIPSDLALEQNSAVAIVARRLFLRLPKGKLNEKRGVDKNSFRSLNAVMRFEMSCFEGKRRTNAFFILVLQHCRTLDILEFSLREY